MYDGIRNSATDSLTQLFIGRKNTRGWPANMLRLYYDEKKIVSDELQDS